MDNFQLGLELLSRLLIAALCGAMLGLEREWAQKPAGLRTQVLVTVGCALFAAMGQAAAILEPDMTRVDVTRIASSVAPGLGFLGAGTILHRRRAASVQGLTTAALIWVNGAIGVAIGFGLLFIGIGATGVALVVVVALRYVEGWIGRGRQLRRYRVISSDGTTLTSYVQTAMADLKNRPPRLRIHKMDGKYELRFAMRSSQARHEAFMRELMTRPDVEQMWTW